MRTYELDQVTQDNRVTLRTKEQRDIDGLAAAWAILTRAEAAAEAAERRAGRRRAYGDPINPRPFVPAEIDRACASDAAWREAAAEGAADIARNAAQVRARVAGSDTPRR